MYIFDKKSLRLHLHFFFLKFITHFDQTNKMKKKKNIYIYIYWDPSKQVKMNIGTLVVKT